MEDDSENERPDPAMSEDRAAPDQGAREAPERSSSRRMLVGVGATVLVLLVVFWFIFSYVVDPEVVIEAIRSLLWWQVIVLAAMAIGTYVLQGVTFRNMLKGVGIWDGTLAMQGSLAV